MSLCLNRGCLSIFGLSGSGSDSTVVDAFENPVGRLMVSSTLLLDGVECARLAVGPSAPTPVVSSVSSEDCALRNGEGGWHTVHLTGRTCVHRTDFGPCVSQK